MNARRPEDAVDRELATTRRAAGLVSRNPIIASGRRLPGASVRSMFAPEGKPVQLKSTVVNRRLWFLMVQDFLIVECSEQTEFIAIPMAYIVQLLDRDDNEGLAYHWRPHGRSTVTEPHLHLATGLLTLAGVVRMLIAEFGGEPLAANWLELLSA